MKKKKKKMIDFDDKFAHLNLLNPFAFVQLIELHKF